MAKIDSITLRNFKFFGEIDPIKVESKHVLLYGENGSGKSSIFAALRLLLNSGNSMDIKNRFNKNHKDSFVNIHAPIVDTNTGEAGVFIEVDLDNTGKYRISFDDTDIENMQTQDRKESSLASDFIDYKFIFKTHLSVGNEMDLFNIFEEEILPFIEFGTSVNYYEYEKGVPTPKTTKSPEIIWKELKDENNQVKNEEEEYPLKRQIGYTNYEDNYNSFKSEIGTLLAEVQTNANEILQRLGYKISIEIAPEFTLFTMTKKNFVPPVMKIPLKIKEYYGMVDVIKKHTSFWNEAKLTAIALAIRLAFLKKRLQTDELKILVLDDLMISLDMSNRDKVLQLLFSDYLHKYQTFILTHDKVFFELVRREIEYGNKSDEWVMYEMFVDDKTGIEQPFIKERKDLLVKAREYFSDKDYPACANTLRQAAEKELARLIPSLERRNKEGITIQEIGSMRDNTGILEKAKKYFEREKLDDCIPFLYGIDKYKDTIFNPQSHYNAFSQIYREELKSAINLITYLNQIKNDTILPIDRIIKINYQTASGVTYTYTAQLKDDLKRYKYEDNSGNAKAIWGTIIFEIQSCVCSNRSIPPFHKVYKYNRKSISDNYEILAEFTEDYHNKENLADQTTVIRGDVESAITDENGNTLNSLKRY